MTTGESRARAGTVFQTEKKPANAARGMVVIFGAGHAQLFMPGRVDTVIDGYTTAPAAARPDMYRPVSDSWPDYLEGAIAFEADGTLTGASCWRADGSPIGIGGGYARQGIRFWPDARRR